MEKSKPAYIDLISNNLNTQKDFEQFEDSFKARYESNVKDVVKRLTKVKSFISFENGDWTDFYQETKDAFSMGYYRSVVALVGIMAEAYSEMIFDKIQIKSRSGLCNNSKLFGEKDRIRQARRLDIIKELGGLEEKDFNKLKYIAKTRNRLLHRFKEKVSEDVALKVLNSFLEVIESKISNKHTLKNGKNVLKD